MVTKQAKEEPGMTDDGETDHSVPVEEMAISAEVESAKKISWTLYVLPLLSGLIALIAAGCLVMLAVKRRR